MYKITTFICVAQWPYTYPCLVTERRVTMDRVPVCHWFRINCYVWHISLTYYNSDICRTRYI